MKRLDINEIEYTCENCKWEYEEFEGIHCRHCIHSAEENFEPKENFTLHEKEIRNKAIDDFAEKIADWCDFCNGGMRKECVKDSKCKIYEIAERLKGEKQ